MFGKCVRLSVLALAGLVVLFAADEINVGSVVQMMRQGLSDDKIVAVIETAPVVSFNTDPSYIAALRQGGFSEKILQAMVKRQVQGNRSSGQSEVVDASFAADEINVGSVVQMMRQGLSDDKIVAVIETAPVVPFNTDPSYIAALRQGGFSEKILQAMVKRQVQGNRSSGQSEVVDASAPGAVPEPDSDGYYYLQESSGTASLRALERVRLDRRNTKVKRPKLFVIASPTSRQVSEVEGNRSPVRFPSGLRQVFVVNRGDLIDVNGNYRRSIRLMRLDPKRRKREIVWGKFSMVNPNPSDNTAAQADRARGVRLSATAYGQRSIRIVPEAPLPPGEYAFMGGNAASGYAGEFLVFCFGIDK